MSTLIFGNGFVGRATASIIPGDIVWHDPAQGHVARDLQGINRAVICVPTPGHAMGLDHTAVYDCLISLASRGWTGPVAVRSTCMPLAFDSMLTINANLVYWPEFLRESHATTDAATPPQVILGGEDHVVHEWRVLLRGNGHAPDAIWTLTDIKTAALIKLGINAALAAKVMMFNSLHAAAVRVGADWESVRIGVGYDPRIGTGQTAVPGPDGRMGFGGKCLPKDTGAVAAMLTDDRFLRGLIEQNERLRDA